MQVGIDITPVMYHRGVSRYTANLVRVLLERRDIQLSLYGSSLRQASQLRTFVQSLPQQSRLQARIQNYPPRLQHLFWNILHTNKLKKLFPNLEVFHSWDWVQPPDTDLPLVSTIHDVAMLKYPETAHPEILKMHQQSWKILRRRGAEIIAVSQSTKRDIVQLLDFPSEKVHVIYEALPIETMRVSEEMSEEKYELLKQKLKLDRPYLLFVGTREPRKNLARLLQAWEPLAKQVDLIVAGEVGWDGSDQLAKSVHHPNLRFLGKVGDEELHVLYGEAEVFVYPSLYEGFGLPVLEAFSAGTPVVTSQISAMPEVAGNAAELVDPQSVESIRAGIETILHESREAQQKRLQRMIIRLQLFHWSRVADETVKVYQRVIDTYV